MVVVSVGQGGGGDMALHDAMTSGYEVSSLSLSLFVGVALGKLLVEVGSQTPTMSHEVTIATSAVSMTLIWAGIMILLKLRE